MNKINESIFTLIFLVIAAVSCEIVEFGPERPASDGKIERTMIMCSIGFNNLPYFMESDLKDMMNGTYIPSKNDNRGLVLISQFAESVGRYNKITPIHVIRVWKENGKIVRDTMKTIHRNALLIDGGILRECFNEVIDKVPSKNYGIVFSTHGTGWIPKGVYDRDRVDVRSSKRYAFGMCAQMNGNVLETVEIDIDELAAEFPIKMEYIAFDACLMGCVEVAYEFRNVCDKICFSPTEVLTEGFEYKTLCENLLKYPEPRLEAVAKSYFDQYGPNGSATISVVDCRHIENLASVCKDLFEKYRDNLDAVNPNEIQRYFRPDGNNPHCWFYDLEDILIRAGISESEQNSLESVLSEIITYKAHSNGFLGVPITKYSGMSMYLPKKGNDELDAFYRKLEWNKSTGLVK